MSDGSLEDLHNIVADHFRPFGFQILSDSPRPKRYHKAAQGSLALHFLSCGADVRISPEPAQGCYIVGMPLDGCAWLTVDGERLLSDRETATITGPGQHVSLRRSSDNTSLIIRLPQQAIDQAVRDYLGDEPASPLRFATTMDFTHVPAARQWGRLVHLLAEELECGAVHNSPLAAQHFEQLLVHKFLYAQPHNLSAALPGPHHAVSPRAVQRAMRFCEEHAAEPVSVADMAAAARTSVRTLQELFRQHEQMTPMAYLRRVRLGHAHADLLAIARGQAWGTVADVAYRWGFAHLSRFARFYREAYGCSPSQTVRGG